MDRSRKILATCGSWKKRAAGHERTMTIIVTTVPVAQFSQKAVEAKALGNSGLWLSRDTSRGSVGSH
jgi:hypothetical protein